MVGICLGGGYAVRAAATDPRLRAAVGIAGRVQQPGPVRPADGRRRDTGQALRSFLDRYDEFLPAVAPDGGEAAMGGDEPFAYYGTARSASPHWVNAGDARIAALAHDLRRARRRAAARQYPLLIVHGAYDDYCSPDLAEAMFAEATGPKEMLWLDTDEHISLYDVEPHVGRAAEKAADFLHRHLGGG